MVWGVIAYNTRSPLVLIRGTKTVQCTVTIFPWHARSPDLSRIEHIWDHLGRQVGHLPSLNELEARLQQIWNEMSHDIIQNLYASMPDRITSCSMGHIFLGTASATSRSISAVIRDKGENARQVAEIANDVYGPDTVTANYVQFRFHRFRLGIFDVKDAPHTGRFVVENVYKITEKIEVDRHVSSRSIAQELKIDYKTVLSHLRKVGFKTKLHVWELIFHTN
ncbi:transposable element Tcb1 transposase [Trichonephila clavipes]|nr:transposable element Tcb1 transposase [Trichonephila clavipes]